MNPQPSATARQLAETIVQHFNAIMDKDHRTTGFFLTNDSSLISLIDKYAETKVAEATKADCEWKKAHGAGYQEWVEAVLGRLQVMPEWLAAKWGGDIGITNSKQGWGFNFEFVGWMEREIVKLEAERDQLRAEVKQLTTDIEQGFMKGAYARLSNLQKAEADLAEARAQLTHLRAKYQVAFTELSNLGKYDAPVGRAVHAMMQKLIDMGDSSEVADAALAAWHRLNATEEKKP